MVPVRKKRPCKGCKTPSYIFSRGMCRYCALKSSKKKKKKVKPKTERQKLVTQLTTVFNRYIRKRNADSKGMVFCITSGKKFHWKELDSGHFITAKLINTRWNEVNVFPQSEYDNRFLSGRYKVYRQKLVEIYGEEFVANLELESKKPWKPSNAELKKLVTKYKLKLKNVRGSSYTGKRFGKVLVMYFDPTNSAKRICKVNGKLVSMYTNKIKNYDKQRSVS